MARTWNSVQQSRRGLLAGGAGIVAASSAGLGGVVHAERVREETLSTTNDVTVGIPSDYPDLQAAVDGLAASEGNAPIVLVIESGHGLTAGLRVENGDYSRFRIDAEDTVVFLDPSFVGVDDVDPPWVGASAQLHDNLIVGVNARMPVLNCVIDMDNQHGRGFYGAAHCEGVVMPDCGVINAGDTGLEWRNGSCFAIRTVWDGANQDGARIQQAATVTMQAASVDNCQRQAGHRAILVSRGSVLHFQDASCQNSGSVGVSVHRATFIFENANLSGATREGIEAISKADLKGRRAVVDNSGGIGIDLAHATSVDLTEASVADSTGDFDIQYDHGSIINAAGLTTTNGTPSVDDFSGTTSFNSISSRGIVFA